MVDTIKGTAWSMSTCLNDIGQAVSFCVFYVFYDRKMDLSVEVCCMENKKMRMGLSHPLRGFSSQSIFQIIKKELPDWIVLFSLWRRTWDSNPRGCYTLLDFQSSSLATRSILHMWLCSPEHF